jgi:hypothetical protein
MFKNKAPTPEIEAWQANAEYIDYLIIFLKWSQRFPQKYKRPLPQRDYKVFCDRATQRLNEAL